jgi:NAD(P)-dependent dehydrogenase (short-subunit alcohol dehydrogenase family)
MKLTEKVALVTGKDTGTGLAVGERFITEGSNVIGAGRNFLMRYPYPYGETRCRFYD